jgi:hypothetical protein
MTPSSGLFDLQLFEERAEFFIDRFLKILSLLA